MKGLIKIVGKIKADISMKNLVKTTSFILRSVCLRKVIKIK